MEKKLINELLKKKIAKRKVFIATISERDKTRIEMSQLPNVLKSLAQMAALSRAKITNPREARVILEIEDKLETLLVKHTPKKKASLAAKNK